MAEVKKEEKQEEKKGWLKLILKLIKENLQPIYLTLAILTLLSGFGGKYLSDQDKKEEKQQQQQIIVIKDERLREEYKNDEKIKPQIEPSSPSIINTEVRRTIKQENYKEPVNISEGKKEEPIIIEEKKEVLKSDFNIVKSGKVKDKVEKKVEAAPIKKVFADAYVLGDYKTVPGTTIKIRLKEDFINGDIYLLKNSQLKGVIEKGDDRLYIEFKDSQGNSFYACDKATRSKGLMNQEKLTDSYNLYITNK